MAIPDTEQSNSLLQINVYMMPSKHEEPIGLNFTDVILLKSDSVFRLQPGPRMKQVD